MKSIGRWSYFFKDNRFWLYTEILRNQNDKIKPSLLIYYSPIEDEWDSDPRDLSYQSPEKHHSRKPISRGLKASQPSIKALNDALADRENQNVKLRKNIEEVSL